VKTSPYDGIEPDNELQVIDDDAARHHHEGDGVGVLPVSGHDGDDGVPETHARHADHRGEDVAVLREAESSRGLINWQFRG
jgi:hypothetical protein